jgi:hypothetical protein
MNATEAIVRIKSLLGLEFRAEKFATTKLMDGSTEVTNNKEDDLAIGDTLYVVGESTLSPAPEGEHITREGVKVYVDSESIITGLEMEGEMEDEVKEDETKIEDEKVDMMSSATLPDGTKVETDEDGKFAVGQQLYFITSEGEKVTAPEGEHTTESGVVIVTDDKGIITGVKYPDETAEGSLGSINKDMQKMSAAMSELTTLVGELNGKFKTEIATLRKEVSEFKKQPDREPVLKKFSTTKTDLLDWKIELIKGSKNIKK